MNCYKFPEQKILQQEALFSREKLSELLTQASAPEAPVTGYIRFADSDAALYFLFFLNGAPYAAGRYAGGRPVSYTIRELGDHLATSASATMKVALCQTDPVLLKCMLLFLQEEPAVKAPTTLIDLEYIVRQIGEAGSHALITLCREQQFNFFFFKNGKAALAHFADQEFERAAGMTVDEEMLLYTFQPGAKVDAYVFRDMVTEEAKDAALLDSSSLLEILTGGTGQPAAASPQPERTEILNARPRLPSVVLSLESGPQQGERFTVTLPCVIGRKGCDLVLNDGQISRRHAELKVVERKLVIEDLGSTNGTMVNGENVTSKRLSPGDLLTIGETSLRVTPV
ncbi:MAG: FHA domain-containing protein [Geobacteraceae bacterium]|nr:FHA domain-containing protein [Geobacteraceae bacterium]